jgi:hypothetical protein
LLGDLVDRPVPPTRKGMRLTSVIPDGIGERNYV